MSRIDLPFKAYVVYLIRCKKPENALRLLGRHYRVAVPKLKVGMPKGHRKKSACYSSQRETIYVSNRENLYNPRVILHEFYHHLRLTTDGHGGVERNADEFARGYVEAYAEIERSFKEWTNVTRYSSE